jgi:hypothetical protein
VQIHLDESADCRCNSWVIPGSWQVQPIDVHPDYFAAVVTSKECSTVQLQDLDDEAID